jgi:hypothetical protein
MYGNERREAIPSLRRKIAATVTQAWTTIPHVHQFQDADITDLLALHKRYAPQFKEKGATLTLTSLFLKAVTHALKLYPQFNASLDLTNGEVIYKEYYNIGVAVETPDGLIVPVIQHVDHKDLLLISLELSDLAELTRARAAGIETLVLSHRGWETRDDYDRALARELRARGVTLVCLAGFMRLVGPPLIEAFPNAILNIHPSLLPAFPGVDAQRQAVERQKGGTSQ